MKVEVFKNWKTIGLWVVCTILTLFVWIGLEQTLDGKIISLKSDSVMCLLLSYLETYWLLDNFERKDN